MSLNDVSCLGFFESFISVSPNIPNSCASTNAFLTRLKEASSIKVISDSFFDRLYAISPQDNGQVVIGILRTPESTNR